MDKLKSVNRPDRDRKPKVSPTTKAFFSKKEDDNNFFKAPSELVQRQAGKDDPVQTGRIPTFSLSDSIDLVIDGFDTNSSVLKSDQIEQLSTFAQFATGNQQQNPNSFITVVGYTDAVGTEKYNISLGQRRADVVRSFLIFKKVPAEAIHAYSLGESNLKIPTQKAESRNRRSEISLTIRKGPGPSLNVPELSIAVIPLPKVVAPIPKPDGNNITPDPVKPIPVPTPDPDKSKKKEEDEKPHFGFNAGIGGQTQILNPNQPFGYAQISGEYSDAFLLGVEREKLPTWLRKHVSSLKFIGEPGLTLQFHFAGDSIASFDLQFLMKLIQVSIDNIGDVSIVAGAGYNDIFNKPDSVRLSPLVGVEGEHELGKIKGAKVSIVIDVLLNSQAIDQPGQPAGTKDPIQTRETNVQVSGEARISF